MALLTRLAIAGVAVALVGSAACANEADRPVASDATVEEPPPTIATTTTTVPTTTTTRSSDPCIATVQTLGTGSELAPGVDLIELFATGQLAPLPVPGADEAVVVRGALLPTPRDYTGIADLRDPLQRQRDLDAAGYAGGIWQDLQFGEDSYGAIILELGDDEQASGYEHTHLTEACQGSTDLRAMADLPSGASFYRSGLARATFVLGSYEINLNICSCVEVADRQALAEQWATDIVTDANAA